MKNRRHMEILDIINKKQIDTQEKIMEELHKRDFIVTQATVSRDIKDLGLVKVKGPDGLYYYAYVDNSAPGGRAERMIRLLRNSVLGMEVVNNIVVVKTLSGSANTAAEAIDSFAFEAVKGTLAGDDNVWILLPSKEDALDFVERLTQYIRA